MDDSLSNDRKRTWFLAGIVLTCLISAPLFVGVYSFRGISEQKATGLGAVAGGLVEAYVILAVILAFVLPLAAIFLLGRSLSRRHGMRAVFSVLCICWNAVTLVLAGLFVWLYFVYLPRAGARPLGTP
jgi:hypothetical protein